jgi:hypothetical protein
LISDFCFAIRDAGHPAAADRLRAMKVSVPGIVQRLSSII